MRKWNDPKQGALGRLWNRAYNWKTNLHTHIHTDTQTHTHTGTQAQTDTQTHRHTDTDRHTNTQAHKHTGTQAHTHRHTHTTALPRPFLVLPGTSFARMVYDCVAEYGAHTGRAYRIVSSGCGWPVSSCRVCNEASYKTGNPAKTKPNSCRCECEGVSGHSRRNCQIKHTFTHTSIHPYIHIHTCTHTHTHTHKHTDAAKANIHTQTHTYTFTHAHTHTQNGCAHHRSVSPLLILFLVVLLDFVRCHGRFI